MRDRKPRRDYGNPWNLTPAQSRVMDAMCAHGCHKLAAQALGISAKTVEVHTGLVAARMEPLRTPLMRYLAWDRWRRGATAPGFDFGETKMHPDMGERKP